MYESRIWDPAQDLTKPVEYKSERTITLYLRKLIKDLKRYLLIIERVK
jgi:hypothetical protein